MTRGRSIASWTLTVPVAAMFLFAGSLKVLGVPLMVQAFATIGLGQWFRYFTGTLEIASALLLFVPALAPFAAMTLAVVMIGATIAHFAVIGGSPAIPITLFVATVAIAWLRRGRTQSALAQA